MVRSILLMTVIGACLAGPVRGQSPGQSASRWRFGGGVDVGLLRDRTRYVEGGEWARTDVAGVGVSALGELRLWSGLWAGLEAREWFGDGRRVFTALGGLAVRSSGPVAVGVSAGAGLLAYHEPPLVVVFQARTAGPGAALAQSAAPTPRDGPGWAVRLGVEADLPYPGRWAVTPRMQWVSSLGDYERQPYDLGIVYRRRFRELRIGLAVTRR